MRRHPAQPQALARPRCRRVRPGRATDPRRGRCLDARPLGRSLPAHRPVPGHGSANQGRQLAVQQRAPILPAVPGRRRQSHSAAVQHHSSCSQALRQAAEPAIRAYRRQSGPHSTKAPARPDGYRPEHIPALLEQSWYQQHLAPLEYDSPKNMRRTGAVLLVQWAAGGSMGDAAEFLGINPNRGQHAPPAGLYRWLRHHGSARFTAALQDLARSLDNAPALTDYRQRRQALRGWCLDPGTWREITSRLPSVPGPVQPTLDDRKRQEASAFVWAHVTQGELRFAPRPIESEQPEPVRKAWLHQRGATWFQLSRPDPLAHYAELGKLLIQHAEHLAKEIDTRAETTRCQPPWPGSN
jgi:hypothetical protein